MILRAAFLLASMVLAAGTRAEVCAYAKLPDGPYATFSLVDDAIVSSKADFLVLRKVGEETRVAFADGDSKVIQAPSDQPAIVVNDHEIGLASKGAWTAQNVRTDARRSLGPEARNAGQIFNRQSESQGRIRLKTLYATVLLLKIMPEDAQAYGKARADLLAGSWCGKVFARLAAAEKKRAAALLSFMLFDDLSEGRLDDLAGWRARKESINALATSPVFDAVLDAYCFRAVEAAQPDPVLRRVDPYKIYSFVRMAVAGLFQVNHELIKPADFGHFTDISVYQRDDRLSLVLLGTQSLAGGLRNKWGFYQRAVGEIDARSLKAPQSLAFDWSQAAKKYHATVSLTPRQQLRDILARRFPAGARHGIVLFDKTLDPGEVDNARRQYGAYFENAGFTFGLPRPLEGVGAYLTRERPPAVDYIVREGHADGDDDIAIVLYQDGFVQRADNPVTGESVEFVYNLQEEPKAHRFGYDEFAELLARRGAASPLVYIDTSCWGLEKAWVSLAHFEASRLLQLASRTPVNQFRGSAEVDATRIALDAIRAGETFDGVRSKWRRTPDYASGKGDNFVLPDESQYPQARPLIRVQREIFVREGDKPAVAYVPDGYY